MMWCTVFTVPHLLIFIGILSISFLFGSLELIMFIVQLSSFYICVNLPGDEGP